MLVKKNKRMLYGGGEEKAIGYVSVKSSLTDF